MNTRILPLQIKTSARSDAGMLQTRIEVLESRIAPAILLSGGLNSVSEPGTSSAAPLAPDGSAIIEQYDLHPTAIPLPPGDSLNANGLQFQFNIAPGTPQTVVDGFIEAGALWSQVLTDDILVVVDISFPVLGPGILGSTGSTKTSPTLTAYRDAVLTDVNSADDAIASGSIPGGGSVNMLLNRTSNNPNGAGSATPYLDNDGDANNTTVWMTTANAKAVGLVAPGNLTSDADISFSSAFTWDFDRSDGITPGAFDFVGVAAHEIGHALGFVSGVDVLDNNAPPFGGPFADDQFVFVSPVDLHRFSTASFGIGPGTIDFTANTAAKFFSIDGGATQLTTFSTGRNFGDGSQASHWQDNLSIGIMDPTLAPGEFADITAFDLQLFDVIGWDVNDVTAGPDPTISGTNGADTFTVRMSASEAGIVDVLLNNVVVSTHPVATTNSLTLLGLGGNDTLTVDSTNGLVPLINGIHFNGGAGFNALNLTQTGGATHTSDTYSVGPNVGDARSTIVGVGATQLVLAQNIAPVVDLVPAATLVVNGTASANAISYGPGGVVTNGLVTIDGFEAIEFSNKVALTLNGFAGSDEISLSNPNVPTGLTGISVDGGNPTGSDRLIVNAQPGVFDPMVLEPTAAGAGTVIYFNGNLPNVAFAGTEHLTLVGQLADGDPFGVDGTIGDDQLQYRPGATPDTGTITGTMNQNAASFALVPVTFTGMAQASVLVYNTFAQVGGTDSFVYDSSSVSDNIGVVGAGVGGVSITNVVNGLLFANLIVGNISSATIHTFDGDDTIAVVGNITVPLALDGGNPSASDTLNYTGPGAGTTTIDLTAGSIDSLGNGLVTFTGIETLNAVLGAGDLALTGSPGSDAVTLTPVGGFTLDDITPNIRLQATNTGTLNLNLAGADDSLAVVGTGGVDSFTFAGTASDAGTVTLNALPIITFSATEKVTLRGADGDDTFNLDGANGAVTLLGGAGSDRVNFSTAAVGVVFDLDAVGIAQRVAANEATVTLLDRIENFTGTAFNDVLFLDAATFARDINGGLQVSIPPGDKFIFDSLGVLAQVLPTDSNTGTIKAAGFANVTYDEFETGAIVNSPGGGGFGAPGASDAFTAGAVYNLTQTVPLPAKPLIGRGPTAVAVGDVNGDGFPDMVTANSKSKFLSILLGLGDGTFGQPTNILSGGTAPTDVGLADLDGDLDLDIVVTNKGTKTVGVLLNGAGVFGAPLLTPKLKQAPTALALGDVNGDLVPDVVVTHPSAGAVSVFLTGAGGVLGAQALVKTGGKGSGDVVLGDFSGDGLLDIATANGASGNASLLVNAGAGVFSITPQVFKTGTRPSALAAADFNNDGKLDLAISHAVSRFVGILIGNGAPVATFKPVLQVNTPKEQLPRSIAAGDFNGDGKIDLAMGPTVGGKLRVILGAGQGDFSQPFEFDLGNKAVRQVSNLALADVNLDGQLDIITANTNSSDISVLLRKV